MNQFTLYTMRGHLHIQCGAPSLEENQVCDVNKNLNSNICNVAIMLGHEIFQEIHNFNVLGRIHHFVAHFFLR